VVEAPYWNDAQRQFLSGVAAGRCVGLVVDELNESLHEGEGATGL
jgi:hypothetical protein